MGVDVVGPGRPDDLGQRDVAGGQVEDPRRVAGQDRALGVVRDVRDEDRVDRRLDGAERRSGAEQDALRAEGRDERLDRPEVGHRARVEMQVLVAPAGGHVLDRGRVVAAGQDDRHAQALRGGPDRRRGPPARDRHHQGPSRPRRGPDDRFGRQAPARARPCPPARTRPRARPAAPRCRPPRPGPPTARPPGRTPGSPAISSRSMPVAHLGLAQQRGPVPDQRAPDAVAVALLHDGRQRRPARPAGHRAELDVDVDEPELRHRTLLRVMDHRA